MKVTDAKHTIVLMDGRRLVAKASKRSRDLPWLLKLYGGCWIKPLGYQENSVATHFGIKTPHLMTVSGRREALRIMQDLAKH